MVRSSRLSLFCDRVLEAGWLLALIIAPVFFNVYSSRVFEPDRTALIRALATFMAAFGVVRWLDGRLRGEVRETAGWRAPLVLPAAGLMAAYLLSSLFSLVPSISLWGSYQRFQGVYSLFGYLVIFLAILRGLRTRSQLNRLLTVVILSSLPVSLYGLVQHYGADPLPWAGDVQTRVSSTLGNSTFAAAYLIMVVPLTALRVLENVVEIFQSRRRWMGNLLGGVGYLFILGAGLLALWYTQSRGPWLGLLGAAFFLPYLILVAVQRQHSSALVKKLWLGWLGVGLVAGLAALAVNLPGPWHDQLVESSPTLRLDLIRELESPSGRVRALIWQGTTDLIFSSDPVKYPDGHSDPYSSIRWLVGYGPESLYATFPRFYPPELGHYESRTASPDRTHNETLDAWAMTGLPGLAAYLIVYGSLFFWGLRWLGLAPTRRHGVIFWGWALFFMAVLTAAGWVWRGPVLLGLSLPLGLIVGLLAYLTWAGFEGLRAGDSTSAPAAVHPQWLLIAAILAVALAHLIEINVGIAVSTTQTLFWALAGLLVAVGISPISNEGTVDEPAVEEFSEVDVAEEPVVDLVEPASFDEAAPVESESPAVEIPPAPRPVFKGWGAVVSLSLAGMFLLGTLAYDFIHNPQQLGNPVDILIQVFTVRYANIQVMTSYTVLAIFGLTWLLFSAVGLGELAREGWFDQDPGRRWGLSTATFVGIPLSGWLAFSLALAGLLAALKNAANVQPDSQEAVYVTLVNITGMLSGALTLYYGWILLSLAGLLLFLRGQKSRGSLSWGHPWGWLALLGLTIGAGMVVYMTDYNPIRADIIFKQGEAYAVITDLFQKEVAIRHYEKALEYAPREDYYFLFQGKASLERGQLLRNSRERESQLEKTEAILLAAREINPLNPDHSANLGRFYRSWGASVSDSDQRRDYLKTAEENYRIALMLSPHNPILWNELAILYIFDLRNERGYQKAIDSSVKIDPEFDQTWMLMGDVKASSGDSEGAIEAYSKALEISDGSCTVRRVMGTFAGAAGSG